jgi:hypothetical protein
MYKPSNRALFDVPDYLTSFKAVEFNDIRRIVRQIVDGTFDDKADNDKINIAIYHTLGKYEKPYFRMMFLKHLDASALESEHSEESDNGSEDSEVWN